MTVFGLHGGVAGFVKGEPDDQSLDPAFVAEFPDLTDIVVEVASLQRMERSDSQTEAVAACESDPSTADIKAQC